MQRSIIVGLTGGIGSGKSLVSSVIQHCGYLVFNADESAKECIQKDQNLRNQITRLLGEEAFINGVYNRTFVSRKVFNNHQLLEELNALIHPAVINAFQEWLQQKNDPILFKEAAILFESGTYKNCDALIVVHAPEKLRIKRVMERDNISEEDVRQRMAKQWPQEDKMQRADYLIDNSETKMLIPSVIQTLKKLEQKYADT